MRLMTMARALRAAAALGGTTVAGLAAPARGAGAQLVPQVDATVAARPAAGVGGTRSPGGATPLLSAGLRWETPRLSVAVAGDAAGDAATTGARASLLGATPPWRGVHATFAAGGRRDGASGARAEWRGAAGTQLVLDRGAGGVWAGYDVMRYATVAVDTVPATGSVPPNALGGVYLDRSVEERRAWRTASRLSLGGWRSLGAIVTSVAVRGGAERVGERPSTLRVVGTDLVSVRYDTARARWDSVTRDRTVGDSGSKGAMRHVTDADARVTWTQGRVALAASGGMRLLDWGGLVEGRRVEPPGRRAWAAVDATVGVGRRVALVAGAGTRPAAVDAASALSAIGRPGAARTRYATLGVRLSPAVFARPALPAAVRPAAAAFAVRPAGPGRYAVRVRVPAARAIELSGELTGWRSVAMKRVDADTWEAVLAAAPGTYRVSIRVDGGEWVAPPGLAAVDDDYGGSAGVVVVP